jgi:hypothetical protein
VELTLSEQRQPNLRLLSICRTDWRRMAAGLRVDLAKLDARLHELDESASEEAAWVKAIEGRKAQLNRTCLDDGLDSAHRIGLASYKGLRGIPWHHIWRFVVDWARILCTCGASVVLPPPSLAPSLPTNTPIASCSTLGRERGARSGFGFERRQPPSPVSVIP